MKVFGMVTTSSSAAYTPYALQSFFNYTPLEREDRFLLVDNGGATGSADYGAFKRAEVLRNERPLGFAANVNQIMRLASADAADLYFLNNDLIFTPNWLGALIVSERMVLSPMSNWQAPHATLNFHCNRVMELAEYVGNETALNLIAADHARRYHGISREFAVWFFCVKIPFSVYSRIGELDETFGAGGGEDVDYCMRCHLAHIQVGFAMKSFVLHFMGKSTWRGAETPDERLFREQAYFSAFVKKWGSGLTGLALRGDRKGLESDPELMSAYSQGSFANLIKLFQDHPHFGREIP